MRVVRVTLSGSQLLFDGAPAGNLGIAAGETALAFNASGLGGALSLRSADGSTLLASGDTLLLLNLTQAVLADGVEALLAQPGGAAITDGITFSVGAPSPPGPAPSKSGSGTTVVAVLVAGSGGLSVVGAVTYAAVAARRAAKAVATLGPTLGAPRSAPKQLKL